ncbi:cupredoxin domain-containing protein [Burkholderia diffusa]|uniref:cupredoxin domain-containing protein n=1 Tax=Burkholderia diffusa TaxID=488732 RepID=UPI0015896FB7|nr:cupredoxin family protein [Burkholderia diffusa]
MKFILLTSAMLLCVASPAAYSHGDDDTTLVGKPGNAANVTRTVNVEMSDTMRFNPSQLTVKRGETVKFVVENTGKIRHEMMLGTETGLKKHAALMRKFPEMEHAEANAVTVNAGKSAQLIWQFSKTGVVEFACLQPGHYEAGMVGRIAIREGGSTDKEIAAR